MLAPTLLVGLGGIGSKIICNVAELANDKQREKLGFVVFDTDVNELRAIKEQNPFVKTVQTSTRLTVGEYLQMDNNARDTWFPTHTILNSKTLTEGAGQVRAVSRLALETAIRAGKMEPLHEAIQELYELEEGKEEQSLRVIIVSSLAGGTGSGLLLPVALYIKNYLTTRFRQSSNITRGFFILPEVFYKVIPGAIEQNNLKSNAYAALRELDAFLMKGDETLHEKYKNTVRLQFPRIGSDEYDEFNVRPFDFCFLFDAQNSKGESLNSFKQYLQHAADCVFAQSIGPMNKRSNSSEDNTIRKLVAERGRNRYAGAGASILRYPFEDVRDYILLNWANQCISQEWLTYDKLYKELLKVNEDKRRAGVAVGDINRGYNYRTTVETDEKENNPFARNIVRSCVTYDDIGRNMKAKKWEDYVEALIEKVKGDEGSGQDDIDSQKTEAREKVAALTGGRESWDEFELAYDEILKYEAKVKQRIEETAHTIAYTMFKSQSSGLLSKGNLNHRLETHMVDKEGSYIHPNAIRYLLYKILETLEEYNGDIIDQNRRDEDFFNTFEKKNRANPDTEEIESFGAGKKLSFFDKLGSSLNADQEGLKEEFLKYISTIDRYRVNSVLAKVLQNAIKYVNSLSDSFEKFYDSFESKIALIEKRLAVISKKFSSAKGTAVRYVCASDKCLKKMNEKMIYTGGTVSIKGELSQEIYNRIKQYAALETKPSNNSYFSEIFEEGILGFFRNELMQTYGGEVDIDVIDALEFEAKYDAGLIEDRDIQKYVEDAIKDTRELSNPFIEKPLGEETQPIYACAYSKDIHPDDESPRSKMLEKELINGVKDEDMSKHMILFYQAFYGLRATDLSKFAPPEKSPTSSGGVYYKAYFDLIKQIHPVPQQSRALSPHIDRWWHIPSKMTDLDEGNQILQEQRIDAAFFWSLVMGLLEYEYNATERKVYRLRAEKLGMDEADKKLVVSSGADCAHLYEVQDALAIYPKLVDKILERVERLTARDVSDFSTKNILENGELYKSIKELKINQFPLGEDNAVRSIFEMPILMKKSVAPDLYYEENVLAILRTVIAEVKKYLARFCTEADFPAVFGGFLREELKIFIENLKIESKESKFDYYGSVFRGICDIIGKAFDDMDLTKDAKRVDELKQKYSK